VRGVLLTHAHADHSQGGPDCQERGIEVVASERTATLLGDGTDHELGVDAARADGVYPSDYRFTNYRPDRHVAPPTTVSVAGRSFEVVPSPGHATDHVAYITEVDGTRCCFVGDAIAPDGRVNLLNVPGSSLAAYREHIDRLVGRGIDALLPGHGMPMLADGQEAIETVADALKGMSPPPSRT
jgi:glyoxylase-like metal-dependent hydrolase (beta-lactamase superfamily II)